jgi:PAS domain S-box-containing protein
MVYTDDRGRGLFLSTLPAARNQRRLALTVVAVCTTLFLAAVPFAAIPLAPVPAFLPAYEAALFVCDVTTVVLLLGQFQIQQSRAMLVLACAYFFSAVMALAHALSFPGLFAANGLLGGGSQTTAWLYYTWHAGFPLAIAVYACLDGRPAAPFAGGRAGPAIAAGVTATLLAVCAIILAATAGHDALPVIRSQPRVPAGHVVAAITWLATFSALPMLWRRPRSVLNVWLMAVICAWLYDIALAALFNGGRYSLGWYAGRAYGLLAATFVLAVLLLENGALYIRLAAAHVRHTRQLRILYEIDVAVTARRSPAAIAAAVVQPLRHLLDVPHAAISIFDHKAGEAQWLAAALNDALIETNQRHRLALMGDIESLRQDRAGELATQELPEGNAKNALLAAGIAAHTVIPMIAGRELIGAVSFGGESKLDAAEQMRIAREVAMQLAIAITQARLYEQVSSQAADLARSESRLRGILDSAMDAIITVDDKERIVIFNAAAETIFGCPRAEALGGQIARFIPARFRAAHSSHMASFGSANLTSRRMGTQRVVTGLRSNGEEFPIDASISHINGDEGRFYTVILRDVTQRVRADEALRRSKDELRELAAAASSAREQEKSRVARELHDELAQSLTALKMDLGWTRERLAPGQEELQSKVAAMRAMVDSAITATRRISADLRPLLLDDLGLVPAAEWLVQNFRQRTGIQCELTVDPPELDLQDPHATAVFRILQESLTNVAKHAKASRVQVTLRASDAQIDLTLHDNGCGFRVSDPRKPGSLGLAGLRERAYLIDGDITIDSALGQGTLIALRIPLLAAEPAADEAPAN